MAICSSASRSFYTPPRGRATEQAPNIRRVETEQVRLLIDGKFTVDELASVKNPDDTERQIESVADLTFGEYVRLLQNPTLWEKCTLNIDRGVFIKQLEQVREVRNDVMHFDPDGVGHEALTNLRQFAQFLTRLSELAGGTE